MKEQYSFPMDLTVDTNSFNMITLNFPHVIRLVLRQMGITSTGVFTFNLQVGADAPIFGQEVYSSAFKLNIPIDLSPAIIIPGGSPFTLAVNDKSGNPNTVQIAFDGYKEY